MKQKTGAWASVIALVSGVSGAGLMKAYDNATASNPPAPSAAITLPNKYEIPESPSEIHDDVENGSDNAQFQYEGNVSFAITNLQGDNAAEIHRELANDFTPAQTSAYAKIVLAFQSAMQNPKDFTQKDNFDNAVGNLDNLTTPERNQLIPLIAARLMAAPYNRDNEGLQAELVSSVTEKYPGTLSIPIDTISLLKQQAQLDIGIAPSPNEELRRLKDAAIAANHATDKLTRAEGEISSTIDMSAENGNLLKDVKGLLVGAKHDSDSIDWLQGKPSDYSYTYKVASERNAPYTDNKKGQRRIQ